MIPDLSMTNVPRLEKPVSSLNTPNDWLTAPCGQKSESTGNKNPLSVAQTLWVGGGPTEIASATLSSPEIGRASCREREYHLKRTQASKENKRYERTHRRAYPDVRRQ